MKRNDLEILKLKEEDARSSFEDPERNTTVFGCKCTACGLHFNVYTWEPERHKVNTLYCPECGQHEGRFIMWRHDTDEPIFRHVPGDGIMFELGSL